MIININILITLFVAVNFFYGVSSVSEIMDIHDILPNKARPQWLALKTILGILIATGVQSVSAAMLSAKMTESTVVGLIAIAVTGAATLISLVATGDRIKKLGFKNILMKGIKATGRIITKPFTFAFAKPVTLSVIPAIEDTQNKEEQNIVSDNINLNSIKSMLASA